MKTIAIFLVIFLSNCGFYESSVQKDDLIPEAHADSTAIVFKHVDIVDIAGNKIDRDQFVVIHKKVIVEVGSESMVAIPNGATVIDGEGYYLMAGLADMHTHVNYEEDLLPYVANGVTTILNMGSPSAILDFRARVKDGSLLGPTIYASAFVDGNGSRGWIVRSPEEARTDVRDIKSRGWDFIKAYNSIATDVYDTLLDEAKIQNIAVIGHGVRSPGMAHILQQGQRMIAHAEEFIYTFFNFQYNDALIPNAIAIIKNSGAYVTGTLSTYQIILQQWGSLEGRNKLLEAPEIKYVNPKWIAQWEQGTRYIHESGSLSVPFEFQKRFIKAFNDGGIPLLLGTDTPTIPGGVAGWMIHRELRILVESGLSSRDALMAGTVNANSFLQQYVPFAEPFGEVKAGMSANLILLKANPLENVSNVQNRAGVVLHGTWFSEEKLQSMLDTLAEKLLKQ